MGPHIFPLLKLQHPHRANGSNPFKSNHKYYKSNYKQHNQSMVNPNGLVLKYPPVYMAGSNPILFVTVEDLIQKASQKILFEFLDPIPSIQDLSCIQPMWGKNTHARVLASYSKNLTKMQRKRRVKKREVSTLLHQIMLIPTKQNTFPNNKPSIPSKKEDDV